MTKTSELPAGAHGQFYAGNRLFRPEDREASIRKKTAGSEARFARARGSLAGGVSSGLRRQSRPYPMYYQSGSGPVITDVDGNSYYDYALAWGPLILGHSPKPVVEAIREQASRGLTYGAQHDLEYEVAECLTSVIPCADLVCFANSGTEIVQVALRLARAVTGRSLHLKFEGHYHGWADDVLLSYHPSAEQIGAADGRPVGAGTGQLSPSHVRIAQWNDRASVEKIFVEHPQQIASVICEPMLCNSGCIPPFPGFLDFLRDITERHGSVLIFDEVITGFRLSLGGAQEFYGVTPDLATYAKAIGAGTPLSMLAGRRSVMEHIADGRVVHAGTLNGNPLALAAAKVALAILTANATDLYPALSRRGARLRDGLARLLRNAGLEVATNGEGAVFHLSFSKEAPSNYRETLRADHGLQSDFALALLDEGVLVLPDGRWYVSAAHTDEAVDATIAAAGRTLV